MIVAVTEAFVLLMAVNGLISPEPEAASPIEGLSFVQLNVAPVTAVAKYTVEVVAPLHNCRSPGWVTAAIGLTVIVKTFAGLAQPNTFADTVIVAVIGCVVLLIAVKDGISPIPLAANPIPVLLFAQL